MIKSVHKNKFFIEQFILNKDNDFQQFVEVNSNKLQQYTILGYHFSTKEFGTLRETRVLNIYFIRPEYYINKECISLDDLSKAWELFFNCPTKQVFKNPPLKEWIDTKENWCKKLATYIMRAYNKPFEEALSDVYFVVTRLHKKETIYMGSLTYIRNAVINHVKVEFRDNRNKLNQDSGLAISLDLPMCVNEDDENISLMDMIAVDTDYYEDNIEYLETLENCKRLLRKTFSDREIDQILNVKPQFMPKHLYNRLNAWRKQHSPEEIYE